VIKSGRISGPQKEEMGNAGWEDPKGRDHFGDLGIDRRTVLK
jgi:hypothetical protein